MNSICLLLYLPPWQGTYLTLAPPSTILERREYVPTRSDQCPGLTHAVSECLGYDSPSHGESCSAQVWRNSRDVRLTEALHSYLRIQLQLGGLQVTEGSP